MARTDNLSNFLTDVASAIKTKKGDETPIQASNFDTEITNLPTGGGNKVAPTIISFREYKGTDSEPLGLENLDTSRTTSMYGMFESTGLTSLDLSSFDTSKVTTMQNMFLYATALTSLDLSNFDTSNVTNMQQVFGNCRSLTSLNLSNWNTSKVTNMSRLFAGCGVLTSLDLSSFDTSKVTTMQNIFEGCKTLTSLDVSNFDTSKVTSIKYAFYNLQLTSLDLSNWNTSAMKGSESMRDSFYGCSKLENLKIKIMNCDCNLRYCPLTAESVAYILQNLGTVTTARTLTLGATNLAKATQEDLDSATAKGWTVN